MLLTSILMMAMASAAFAGPAVGVLSVFLIDDFEVSRTAIGWVVATGALSGAVLSPLFGKLTDTLGGKRTLLMVFAISGVGLIAHGLAPNFAFLLLAALIFGAGQAGANPSTNTLIGDLLAPGTRGAITGIKQSGVQVGIFLGGLTLPTASLAIGWRWSLVLASAVPLTWLLVAARTIPDGEARNPGGRSTEAAAIHPAIKRIALYGFFMGTAGGSLLAYLALYAHESLGYHVTVAGLAVAVTGLSSVIARVVWGRLSERSGQYARLLKWLAILALVSVVAVGMGSLGHAWLLWPAAVLFGVSGASWNSPGMVAVIGLSGGADLGRSSGLVMLGFSAGFATGPPIVGYTIDSSGDYLWGLVFISIMYVAAIAIMTAYARKLRLASANPQVAG